MEFEILKDDIKNPLLFAEKATGKNMTLPILQTIIITAKKSFITLQATNLDIGVEFIIPAKIIKEGIIAIHGSIITNIVGNLPNTKKITCTSYNGLFSLKTEGNSISIKTYPVDDFPLIPVVKEGEMFTIQSKKIVAGLKSVVYAAALSDIKPEFAGVYIYSEKQHLVFVATDTYRLAEKKIQEKNLNDFQGVIIPHKNIQEIIRIFEGVDDDVSVVSNKNQISFSTETIHISSRAINTQFPEYQEIFPKKTTTEATILKQDLLNTLKLTTVFSDRSGRITLSVDPKNKSCTIFSKNKETGEQKSYIDAAISGEESIHDYNYRYIVECLQYIPQDSVILKISEEGKLVISGLGDNSFSYLIAPLMKQG